MQEVSYYRERAIRVRRLAAAINDPRDRENLTDLARDYSELADDLEENTAEVRHPELLVYGHSF
jgi:hypothetical protein